MITIALAGCANGKLSPTIMQNPAADIYPMSSGAPRSDEYRIGPLDELAITVFQEEDLSLEKVPVDASGNVLFPLIGLVEAAGKTSRELSLEIANKLAARYLVDPQVLVNVSKSASQIVTVEGQVTRPGRFEIQGQATLLTAIASAQGPTQTAKLDEVLIFRTINDQRYAARFDLQAIRQGWQPDPVIKGNDIVVVGVSNAKSVYRDILSALPGLGSIFIALQSATNNN
ncbi:polysaccharide biosynthesis/export family protein [Sphingopyxis sp. 2PD]|uniref:polysaccharide biosynthesis/export family protein n=1 Tax=Sphingopyxis sp. 2PD TaxID=2502196 RepID=UPI00148503BB|nr:polysaccharide biosynthesis/export family protein [Sphingopyxis sp. 2PD]